MLLSQDEGVLVRATAYYCTVEATVTQTSRYIYHTELKDRTQNTRYVTWWKLDLFRQLGLFLVFR